MEQYTQADLEEGIKALASIQIKCEKALTKLKEGTPQHTLTSRRIKAFKIAIALTEEKHEEK